jgi:hypothetical protein
MRFKHHHFLFIFLLLLVPAAWGQNQENLNLESVNLELPGNEISASETEEQSGEIPPDPSLFDDKQQLQGFTERYKQEPMGVLMAMIKDETLDPYRTTAAVRVFRQNYYDQVFLRDKALLEKTLLRRLSRTRSPFLQIEIMHTLCLIDRYKYFNSMVPALIQKLDHYNSNVNDLAYESLEDIVSQDEHPKPREARLVFNYLRKSLFLSRRRLASVTEPSPQLTHKLDLLRWSIKILGTEELNRLPQEVIHLL